MKKAVNISIAQTLFTIEEDAFVKLDDYLKSIRDHFSHTKDHGEIVEDIEARISEKFLETKKKIITTKEVESVVVSMGKVSDFGNDDVEEDENVEISVPARKKLYRNSKDKIVAGVCSGLAAYFNIDPLWIRIVFVIFIVCTYGFGIILYLILFLVIPEAKTTSQTLEMKGMPVTLETMSDNLKETVKAVRVKHGSKFKQILSWPFKILKSIIDFLMTFLLPLIRVLVGVFIAIFSLGAIVAGSIFTSLILTNGEGYIGLPINTIVSTSIFYLTIIGVYLAALIPLIALFILSISIIRKKHLMNMTLGLTFLFAWCGAAVGAGVGIVSSANSFEEYSRSNPLFEQGTRDILLNDDKISQLDITGGIDLKLVQGDEVKLTVTGAKRMIENFSVNQHDGYLYMYIDDFNFCFFCQGGHMEATLTLPDLELLSLYEGSSVEGEGWVSEKTFEIHASDDSDADLKIEAPEIIVLSTGGSHLNLELDTLKAKIETSYGSYGSNIELSGTIAQADFLAESESYIDAVTALIERVKVNARYGSNVDLGTVKFLEKTVDSGSSVTHQGDPEIIDLSPQEDQDPDQQNTDEFMTDEQAQSEAVMENLSSQQVQDLMNDPAWMTITEEGYLDEDGNIVDGPPPSVIEYELIP